MGSRKVFTLREPTLLLATSNAMAVAVQKIAVSIAVSSPQGIILSTNEVQN